MDVQITLGYGKAIREQYHRYKVFVFTLENTFQLIRIAYRGIKRTYSPFLWEENVLAVLWK
jgi:hypothetical protein